MKAAIAIDKWKLPVFSKQLVAAGFHYEQLGGNTRDSYLLVVDTPIENQQKLAQVILAANTEASKNK